MKSNFGGGVGGSKPGAVILPWILVVRNSIRRNKSHVVEHGIPLVLQRDPRESVVNPAFENSVSAPYYGRTLPVDVVPPAEISKATFERTFSDASNGGRKYGEVPERNHANGTTGHIYDTVASGTLLRSKEEERKLKSQEKWLPGFSYYTTWICITLGVVNLWRFPSVVYVNGGGVFIFAYVVMAVLLGIPMFILETAVGQFTGSRSTDAWKCVPLLKGLTLAQAISCFYFIACLLHVMGLGLVYMLDAVREAPLPWSRCNNDTWATYDQTDCSNQWNTSSLEPENYTTSHELYLRYHVWQDFQEWRLSNLNWYLAGACFVATVLVAVAMAKGFWIIRRIAFFFVGFATLCFLSFLIMLLVDVEGTAKGIKDTFIPDWKKLASVELWYGACEHVFLSMGIGLGPLVTYASRNHFNNNVVRHSVVFVVLEVVFSLLALYVISASLGHMAHLTGANIQDLLRSSTGMGVVFVASSHMFSNLSFVPVLWLFLFFVTLVLLAFMSLMVLTDVFLSTLWDKYECLKNRRWLTRIILCLLVALLDVVIVQLIGPRGFDILDRFGIGAPCFIYVTLEVISMTWIYGIANFRGDVSFMVKSHVPGVLAFVWSFAIPVGLTALGIALLATSVLQWIKRTEYITGRDELPYFVGQWIVFSLPVLVIVVGIFRSLCNAIALGCCERFRYVVTVSPDWGPSDPFFRRHWLRQKQGAPRAASVLRSNGNAPYLSHPSVRESSISTISRSWNS